MKNPMVVGIGETDYLTDYRKVRNGMVGTDDYGYAARAFVRALKDSGLKKSDIDGLIVGPTTAYERMGEILGINPKWSAQGDASTSVILADMAIRMGYAECIALVYGNAQRSGGTQYGGQKAMGGDSFLSYVYYAPWGMTSQGALYGIMTRRYMEEFGLSREELGNVAVSQRKFASMNENAIMRVPISIDDYLNSRYIAEPLCLYDYCLINDGGVCLIITTEERAKKLHVPLVEIGGIARSDYNLGATQLRPRLIDFYHTPHKEAAERLYNHVGFGPEDVDSLQIYDSFSSHILFALEGFGFCPMGEAGDYISKGSIGPGGKHPVNTSGGHLSESYMQGWNHQIEAIRQLRGQAGPRQVNNCQNVQYISDIAGKVNTIMYLRRDH